MLQKEEAGGMKVTTDVLIQKFSLTSYQVKVLGAEVRLEHRGMNKNNKKCKTILSRSLTERGEVRIIVPSESGSSCEYKNHKDKDGSAGKALQQYTHIITAVTQQQQAVKRDTGTHVIMLHTHLRDLEKIVLPSLS